jgi:hypothetical protein
MSIYSDVFNSAMSDFSNVFYVEAKSEEDSDNVFVNPVAIGLHLNKDLHVAEWGGSSLYSKGRAITYKTIEIKPSEIVITTEDKTQYIFKLLTSDLFKEHVQKKTFPIPDDVLNDSKALRQYYLNKLRA